MSTISTTFNIYDCDIVHSENGLIFKNSKNEFLYNWKNILHIFNWDRPDVLAVIDKNSFDSVGNLYKVKKLHWSQITNEIWREWLEQIPEKELIYNFVYPDICIKSHKKKSLNNCLYAIGLILFAGLSVTYFLLKNHTTSLEIIISLCLFSVGFIGFFYYLRQFRKNNYTDIIIKNNQIEINYENNYKKILNIKNITSHNLNKKTIHPKICFHDKTKLKHLERLSYWPVLKEKLISKINVMTEKDFD